MSRRLKKKRMLDKLRRVFEHNHEVSEKADTALKTNIKNIELLNEIIIDTSYFNSDTNEELKEEKIEVKEEMTKNQAKKLVYSEVQVLLTKIYADKISLDEIKNSNIQGFRKELLLLAYYEKNNKNIGVKYIKELKNKYKDDELKIKNLNKINQNMSNKKNKWFVTSLYEKFLKAPVDLNILEQENEEVVENKIIEETKIIDNKTLTENLNKVEKVENKSNNNENVVSFSGKTNNRFSNAPKYTCERVEQPKIVRVEKVTTINDIFEEEIEEVRKYLYVKMQLPKSHNYGMFAWDKLEILKDKPITNIDSLKRLVAVLKVLEGIGYLEVDNDKIKKYLYK